MSENNDNSELDGDRGITSVTSQSEHKARETKKKIGIAAGVAFLAFAGITQWISSDKTNEEKPVTQSASKIKQRQTFQPAEIEEVKIEPAPKVEPVKTPVVPEQVEPSEAEQLLEASRRAPLMVFKGNRQRSATASELSDQEGSFGTSQSNESKGLASEIQTTKFQASSASLIKDPHLTITQGTIIPCTLNNAMDSSLPGLVTCTVNDNVYSTTGAVILLEKGTKIVGQYKGGLKRGKNRLFVIWTRAETPAGVLVNIDSSAADGLGRSGFTGDVDTQFWTRFGGTIMLSVIEDLTKIISQQADVSESIENTSEGASSLAQTELENVINVPVILRKNQGEQVSVMLNRDLDFSGVYRLRLK